ncbi:MAG: glycosyltransferase family 2 protein [Bacteroidetes bacterium]|nr:glycosyltransferase family 2 protein [Bacteroidota bacterium]
MAKVTVIIPVYNTQDYLQQCLDSVINQSLTDIEIICINDGSTDNSLSILKEYVVQDNRLRIIDIERGGQGTARNLAIKEATGEYVGFVDSDDWIENDMFEELYNSASTFATDVTVCELTHFNQADNKLEQPNWTKLSAHINFDNRGFPWDELGRDCFRIGSGPCTKIYRRDFIIKNNIIFAKGVLSGCFVCLPQLCKINCHKLCKKPLYVYRMDREGSTTSDLGRNNLIFLKY